MVIRDASQGNCTGPGDLYVGAGVSPERAAGQCVLLVEYHVPLPRTMERLWLSGLYIIARDPERTALQSQSQLEAHSPALIDHPADLYMTDVTMYSIASKRRGIEVGRYLRVFISRAPLLPHRLQSGSFINVSSCACMCACMLQVRRSGHLLKLAV